MPSPSLKLKQTPEATRRWERASPNGQGRGWVVARELGPLIVFILACLADTLLLQNFQNWMAGKEVSSAWQLVMRGLGWMGGLVLFFLGLLWILRRWAGPAFESSSEGFRFSNRKLPRFRWEQLDAVFLEPIEKDPGLMTAIFCGRPRRRDTLPFKPWRLILDRETQVAPLLEELRFRHAQSPGFLVRVLDRAAVESTPDSARWRTSAYLYGLGLWLLMHGLPILGVIWAGSFENPSAGETGNPPPTEFARFVLDHFQSVESFRRALPGLGGCLSGLGLVLMGVGGLSMTREGRKWAVGFQKEVEARQRASGTTLLSRDTDRSGDTPGKE